MSWFANLELDSLESLLLLQLQALYDAELRLVDAIPKLADGAQCDELRQSLLSHLEETRGHVSRLEDVFRIMDVAPQRMSCPAMKGLVAGADEILDAHGDCYVKDAAIIAAAQRVEHLEIAGYGTLRTWATQLGLTEIAEILQSMLDEESHANHILTEIAEQTVNSNASHAI